MCKKAGKNKVVEEEQVMSVAANLDCSMIRSFCDIVSSLLRCSIFRCHVKRQRGIFSSKSRLLAGRAVASPLRRPVVLSTSRMSLRSFLLSF